jgi:hypothetical protein
MLVKDLIKKLEGAAKQKSHLLKTSSWKEERPTLLARVGRNQI